MMYDECLDHGNVRETTDCGFRIFKGVIFINLSSSFLSVSFFH